MNLLAFYVEGKYEEKILTEKTFYFDLSKLSTAQTNEILNRGAASVETQERFFQTYKGAIVAEKELLGKLICIKYWIKRMTCDKDERANNREERLDTVFGTTTKQLYLEVDR